MFAATIVLKNDEEGYMKSSKEGICFSIPMLTGIVIFYVLGLGITVYYAFTGRESVLNGFSEVFSNEAFRLALSNTVRFQLIVIPLTLAMSFIIEVSIYDLNKNIINILFLLPLAVPSNAVSVIWRIIFSEYGMLNKVLNAMTGQTIDFFSGDGAFWLTVITFVWKNLGIALLIWKLGMDIIPKSIYEAAELDGATEGKQLLYMTIPNLKTVFIIEFIVLSINSFKGYRESFLIFGNYPDEKIYMLQNVFNNLLSRLELSKLASGAIIYMGIILMVAGIIFGLSAIFRVTRKLRCRV